MKSLTKVVRKSTVGRIFKLYRKKRLQTVMKYDLNIAAKIKLHCDGANERRHRLI